MPSLDPTPSVRSGPGLLGALLGVLFAIVGFVLMVGAVLLGLVIAIAALLWSLLWSLLRGRRPAPVRFEWRQATARARRPASGRPASDEVVDVEVREIPDRRQD